MVRQPARQKATRVRAAERADEPELPIVCSSCDHLITHGRHRIERQGSHDHRFMNPAGIVYHIGCFAEAVGCVIIGPPSLEYPWFAGYAWRYAACGGCGLQLGWHFRTAQADADAFFGLILDRLREVQEPPSTPDAA